MSRYKRQNSRGDTIVEVLFVLAILGLALSISYATANRSLINARQGQENAYATELVQSQIEALQSMRQNIGPNTIFKPSNTTFCINTTNTANFLVVMPAPTANPPTPNPCSPDPLYGVSITCTAVPSCTSTTVTTPYTFTAQAQWQDANGQTANGQGTDTVTLVYRLYP